MLYSSPINLNFEFALSSSGARAAAKYELLQRAETVGVLNVMVGVLLVELLNVAVCNVGNIPYDVAYVYVFVPLVL